MDNIVLIGYMGSGKTSVGRYISEKYGYKFLDTDEYIESSQGMSINELFESKGEEYFRKLETDTIKQLIDSLAHTVVATGGGMPVKEENRKYLRTLGKVTYLQTDVDTIYKRLCRDDSRPLLKGENLLKKITDMLEEREQAYKSCANCIISFNQSTSVEEIGDIIITLLDEENHKWLTV